MHPDSGLVRFTDAVIAARRWQHHHFGVIGGQLAFDLVAVVMAHRLTGGLRPGRDLTVKHLVASLPYSEAGVRKKLRRVLADGWVQMVPSPHDGRVRVIKPRAKLMDAWAEYEDLVMSRLRAADTA